MGTSAKDFFSDKPLQDIENEISSLIDQNKELNKRLTEQKNESEKIIINLLREYAELSEQVARLGLNPDPENGETKQLAAGLRELEERLNRFLKKMKVKPLKVTIGKTADNVKHKIKKTARKKGGKNGTILEVIRQGYVWKGLILRKAEVKSVRNFSVK